MINRNTTNMTRSKTPTSKRLIATTRNIQQDKSITPTKSIKTIVNTSVSPMRKSVNVNTSGLKQEVLDLTKLERQLKQKAQQLKTDHETLKEKYQRSMKDLEIKEKKLDIDKNQIIDLFANFVVNKNVVVDLEARKKSKVPASPIRSSKNNTDLAVKSFRDSSATKMKTIFMKNKKAPEIVNQKTAKEEIESINEMGSNETIESFYRELHVNRKWAISSSQRLLGLSVNNYNF